MTQGSHSFLCTVWILRWFFQKSVLKPECLYIDVTFVVCNVERNVRPSTRGAHAAGVFIQCAAHCRIQDETSHTWFDIYSTA